MFAITWLKNKYEMTKKTIAAYIPMKPVLCERMPSFIISDQFSAVKITNIAVSAFQNVLKLRRSSKEHASLPCCSSEYMAHSNEFVHLANGSAHDPGPVPGAHSGIEHWKICMPKIANDARKKQRSNTTLNVPRREAALVDNFQSQLAT